MKREIKFRVWDGVGYMSNPFTLNDLQLKLIQFTEECEIMQYTGLKDDSGREIYEKDIIRYTQHYFNTDRVEIKQKVVEWEYDKWTIYETKAGESNIIIIGNIYENPEINKKENESQPA